MFCNLLHVWTLVKVSKYSPKFFIFVKFISKEKNTVNIILVNNMNTEVFNCIIIIIYFKMHTKSKEKKII